MPYFDELFASTVGSEPVVHNQKKLKRLDYISFEDEDQFSIKIESTNSDWKQGIVLDLFGYFEISGTQFPNKIVLWEQPSKKEILVRLFQNRSSKKPPKSLPQRGLLGVRNVWDNGVCKLNYWTGGAAMIAEPIENGMRYYCNDGAPDEDFDDIIFTIRKLT